MKAFTYLLRRELWEHRALWLVPVIVGVLVITVAAAEAAIGLALIIAIYRHRQTIDIEEIDLMKW